MSSSGHALVAATKWRPELPAERVNDYIVTSPCTSNCFVVTSDNGDVVINTGTVLQGARSRDRFEALLGRELDVRKVVLTQSHGDHMGGWAAFSGPGAETIAHRYYPEGRLDHTRLRPYFSQRAGVITASLHGAQQIQTYFNQTPEIEVDTLFDDVYSFEVGGRAFVLHSIPGGETRDGVCVWLPEERCAFIGNLDGALWLQFPHLSTIRGDRPRSARQFISSVALVRDLEPDLLLTGHGRPIEGCDVIRTGLQRLIDMTEYVHDRTVEGMNAGRSLWDLMNEIRLPAHLEPEHWRGPVWWYVRAVWEEYVGWFRFESTTELYPVPPAEVWSELADLVGGPDVLAQRAARHVHEDRPLHALHLVDIALAVEPRHPEARAAQLAALHQLVSRADGRTFDELTWLESEIAKAEKALAESAS